MTLYLALVTTGAFFCPCAGLRFAVDSSTGYSGARYRRLSGEFRLRTFWVKALTVALAIFVVFAWLAPRLRAEEWMLMGREGGCVTLAQATARLPLLSGVTTPDQLVAKIRRQGEEVRRQDIEQGGVTVVRIDAPGLGLGFIFAPLSLCR